MNNFLSSEQFTLHNIFSGGKYSIPVYQRPYSWTNVEIKNLLEDIFEIYNNESLKNEEKLLFTGTMFIRIGENIRNEYTEYEVVDGQQRITTFTLILMVLLNYFYCNELEDKAIREIEGYLWKEKEQLMNETSEKINFNKDKLNKFIWIGVIISIGSIITNLFNEFFKILFSQYLILKKENAVNTLHIILINWLSFFVIIIVSILFYNFHIKKIFILTKNDKLFILKHCLENLEIEN